MLIDANCKLDADFRAVDGSHNICVGTFSDALLAQFDRNLIRKLMFHMCAEPTQSIILG